MKRLTLVAMLLVLSTYFTFADNRSSKKEYNYDLVNTLSSRIHLMGYAQAGYTYNTYDSNYNTFDIKRIILMAEGQITDKWSFFYMGNLNNNYTLLELFSNYKFSSELQIKFGEFKMPFGIENLMSPTVVELINCYSQGTRTLIGSDYCYGASSGRDIGIQVNGSLLNSVLDYKFAIMNGQGINTKDANNDKDFIAALDIKPLTDQDLLLNISGRYGHGRATDYTENIGIKIPIGYDYERQRYSVGARYINDLYSLRSEYIYGKDANLESLGFYCTGSLNLSPDTQLYGSFDTFDSNLDQDDNTNISYTLGAQYWFYPRCRLQLEYTLTTPDFGDNRGVFQTQIQFRF